MSEVKVLNKGDKFAHASVGSLKAFEGKQFVKDATGATFAAETFLWLLFSTAFEITRDRISHCPRVGRRN